MSNREKLKPKNGTKKDRTFTIHLDPRNYELLDGISISVQGQIQAYKGKELMPFVGKTHLEYGYMRESGKKKTLTTGPVGSEHCSLDPNLPIVNFDHLFAIDTNTQKIGNDFVSVAAVTYCNVGDSLGNQVSLSWPTLIVWYEYRNIVGPQENLAWQEFIEAIQAKRELQSGKIGLIVDSYLDNHNAFNERMLPVYDNFFLPERFTILYGSADVGQESLINRMIRHSDRGAAFLMKYLKQNESAEGLLPVEGKPYSHIRIWDANFDDESNRLRLD